VNIIFEEYIVKLSHPNPLISMLSRKLSYEMIVYILNICVLNKVKHINLELDEQILEELTKD